MAKVRRFEDLQVWQAGRELARRIFQFTAKPAFARKRRFCEQIEAAAISVASNLAEGFERGTRVQFIEFCHYAKGSAGEVRSQLYTALGAGLIDQAEFDETVRLAAACSSMIAKFVDHLKHTQAEIPGSKFTSRADRFDMEEFLSSHGIVRNPDGSHRTMSKEERQRSDRARKDQR